MLTLKNSRVICFSSGNQQNNSRNVKWRKSRPYKNIYCHQTKPSTI
uniref:Uncharacterized protein n=1 Tax=Anguilla anguilla TaxID=7936 RepID=A0A0E9X042_ANGAN